MSDERLTRIEAKLDQISLDVTRLEARAMLMLFQAREAIRDVRAPVARRANRDAIPRAIPDEYAGYEGWQERAEDAQRARLLRDLQEANAALADDIKDVI